MFGERHATEEIAGVPCVVSVYDMHLGDGTAWGYFFVFPDADGEQRVRWDASRPMADADWIVSFGGVFGMELIETAGITLVCKALSKAEQQFRA